MPDAAVSVLVIGVGSLGSTMPLGVAIRSNSGHMVAQTSADRYSVLSTVAEGVQLVLMTLQ